MGEWLKLLFWNFVDASSLLLTGTFLCVLASGTVLSLTMEKSIKDSFSSCSVFTLFRFHFLTDALWFVVVTMALQNSLMHLIHILAYIFVHISV